MVKVNHDCREQTKTGHNWKSLFIEGNLRCDRKANMLQVPYCWRENLHFIYPVLLHQKFHALVLQSSASHFQCSGSWSTSLEFTIQRNNFSKKKEITARFFSWKCQTDKMANLILLRRQTIRTRKKTQQILVVHLGANISTFSRTGPKWRKLGEQKRITQTWLTKRNSKWLW